MARKKYAEISKERKSEMVSDIHKKLSHVRSRMEKINDASSQVQAFVDKGGSLTVIKHRQKASHLQANLLRLADSEVCYVGKLLNDIAELRKFEFNNCINNGPTRSKLMEVLDDNGAHLPLYTSPESPGYFVGAICVPDSVQIEPGQFVACFHDENWILVVVARQLPGGRYEVRDVDVDDDHEAEFTCSRRQLIPLPNFRADPERHPHALFPVNAIVLALYPQTTCFYTGAVWKSPENSREPYLIAFEDSGYPSGYSPPLAVHQRYVITHKAVKHKKKHD